MTETRSSLDAQGTGTVSIDDFARHLDSVVHECTLEDSLTEAFKQFDADNDNRLSLEEFEFFMTGFGKEHNQLMNKQMVPNMLEIIKTEKLASDENPSFDITEIVTRMRSCWAA